MYKLTIGYSLVRKSGVDALDPQSPHIPLAHFAADIGVLAGPQDGFVGPFEEFVTRHPIAFGHL